MENERAGCWGGQIGGGGSPSQAQEGRARQGHLHRGRYLQQCVPAPRTQSVSCFVLHFTLCQLRHKSCYSTIGLQTARLVAVAITLLGLILSPWLPLSLVCRARRRGVVLVFSRYFQNLVCSWPRSLSKILSKFFQETALVKSTIGGKHTRRAALVLLIGC